MGFLCCICHDDLSRKKTPECQNGKIDNAASKQEPTVVTTKCGHLFHSECLTSWFDKKGKQAWTTRECPSCRERLTVATDVIRIFFPFNSSDELQQTTDELKTRVTKLESANKELELRLEEMFLRGRDQEKKLSLIMNEKENLQKACIRQNSLIAEMRADNVKLKSENDELKTVIINLNIKINGGMNGIGGMASQLMPPGHMQQRFPEQMITVGPRPGNMNMVPYGYAPASFVQLSAPSNPVDPEKGWSQSFVNGSSVPHAVGNPTQGNAQVKEALTSQLSTLLLSRNNSRSVDPKNSIISDRKPNNGFGETEKLRTQSSTSDAPTDELMDAILNSEPHPVKPSHQQLSHHPGQIVPNEVYRSRVNHQIDMNENDDDKKIYGKFFCKSCSSKWGNARHNLNDPQKCRNCGELTLPYHKGPVLTKEELALEKLKRSV